jgi:RNA polymerase sigma-70 factor (ECF subfamily)
MDAVPHYIIIEAQQRHPGAFSQIYDAHEASMYALCVGLTASKNEARELMQDTFVRAWENLESFRGECALATWLHRIAVNEHLMRVRALRRRSLRVAIESDLTEPGTEPDTDRLLDRAAASEGDPSLAIDLEDAISRLPEGARTVFILREVAGFSHAEIGEKLGIAEGTSKAHLFRARRLLRGFLRP